MEDIAQHCSLSVAVQHCSPFPQLFWAMTGHPWPTLLSSHRLCCNGTKISLLVLRKRDYLNVIILCTIVTFGRTWSHQHSEKFGNWCSRLYSRNSNMTLIIMHIHQSRIISVWGGKKEKNGTNTVSGWRGSAEGGGQRNTSEGNSKCFSSVCVCVWAHERDVWRNHLQTG